MKTKKKRLGIIIREAEFKKSEKRWGLLLSLERYSLPMAKAPSPQSPTNRTEMIGQNRAGEKT